MKGRKWLSLLISIILIGFVSACGTAETKDNEKDEQTAEEKATDNTNKENDQNGSVDENENASETDEENGTSNTDEIGLTADEEDLDLTKKDVVYTGLADPHTIEVKDGEEYLTLQIDPDTTDEWEKIAEDTTVTIEYYENEHGQNILVRYTVKD